MKLVEYERTKGCKRRKRSFHASTLDCDGMESRKLSAREETDRDDEHLGGRN
jgi:hypothetical protein